MMRTLSGGQLRVTMDGSGHLLPCLGACPPIPSQNSRAHRRKAQAAYAKEVGMGNPSEET